MLWKQCTCYCSNLLTASPSISWITQCICCHSAWIFPGQDLGSAKQGRECPFTPTQALCLHTAHMHRGDSWELRCAVPMAIPPSPTEEKPELGYSGFSHAGNTGSNLFLQMLQAVSFRHKKWNLWQVQITATDRKGQIYPAMNLGLNCIRRQKDISCNNQGYVPPA